MQSSRKVLLIHPLGYDPSNARGDIARVANLMPPLGLAGIAAYLEEHGVETELIDCFAHPENCDRKIREYVRREKPDYAGVSCTTSSFPDTVRLLEMIKSERPQTQTVVGGPHVSALKTKILEENPPVDYAVVGEGEETLRELTENRGDPTGIEGLAHRQDGEVVFNGYRSELLELDSLPFPAYEKLDGFPELYQLPIFNYPTTPNSSCVSSRGCPYQCSYCDRSVFRRSFRYNSADYLYEHLKYMKSRWGIRHINFYDDQFTLVRRRVEEFCRKMIDKPLGMTYNCAVRAEHVDPDLLKLMKASGCWMISLGVETGAQELLSRHRQNADVDRLARRIRQIKRAGIRVKALLMIGLPGETEETVRRSMEYVFSLPIDDFNLSKFTPFPGSPVYENIEEYGTFDEDYEKMDCMHFQFVPDGMTEDQLESLFQLFYRSHFMRPKVLWGYFTMLWESPDSWRRFGLHLKDFLSFAFSDERIRAR
ncbi:MAG: B12-binding domain-containing radical SAM protein [Candidatus Brocadiia bacterium]